MEAGAGQPVSLPRLFLAGAGAACIAETLTLPLDTAKVSSAPLWQENPRTV